MKKLTILATILLAGATALAAGDDNGKNQEQFDQLLKKVQTDPARTSEKEMRTLIDLGRELGRSYSTSLAIRGYFSRNFQPTASLLREAAEIAELSADFRTAAARYKSYLALANDSGTINGDSREVASRAAARLYHVLIDYLDSQDDAFQFIAKHGTKFRADASARKFDLWFLRTAAKNKDYGALGGYLVDCLNDKIDLNKERLYYWDHLDWLTQEVAQAGSEHYPALPHMRKLVKLVRDSKRRSARIDFISEYLAFRAGSAGKEEALLDRQFGSVNAAAMNYFNAFPTAETLKDIVHIYGGGKDDDFHDERWDKQQKMKRRFFVQAFGKLKDADKLAMVDWRFDGKDMAHRLADGADWNKLVLSDSKLFSGRRALARAPFNTEMDSLDEFRKLSRILEGVPSTDAAVINSIAAGGLDYKKVVDHLMQKESWHFSPSQCYYLVDRTLIPTLKRLAEADKKKPVQQGEVWVYLGEKYLSKSPIAYFDDRAAKEYFQHVWRHSGKEEGDKSQVARHLKALAWVPWSRRTRNDVYNQVSRDFKGWAEWVRREKNKKKGDEVPENAVKLITEIDAALKATRSLDQGDADKAPNDLCKQFALMIQADNDRNRPAYVKAGQAAYKALGDYRKATMGRWIVRSMLESRNNINAGDLQAWVLEQALASYDRQDAESDLEMFVERVFDEYKWDWNIHDKYKDEATKVAKVLDGALLKYARKGQVWDELFRRFRMVRSGRGWSDYSSGNELMTTLVEKNLLVKNQYYPGDKTRSGVTAAMYVIRREFPRLHEKYPVETYFDARYIEEARKLGYLDYSYWQYGADKDGNIVEFAATMLGDDATLPFGYEDGKPARYSKDEYWDWCRRLSSEPKVRDDFLAKISKYYGKSRYDIYSLGWAYFSAEASLENADLRKEFFSRLSTVVDRLSNLPSRPWVPHMGELEEIENGSKLSKEELNVLVSIFPSATPSHWSRGWYYDKMGRLVLEGLVAQNRRADLYRVLPQLWKIARDTNEQSYQRELADQARAFLSREQYDLALVAGTSGLEIAKSRLPDDARSTLVAVRSSAVSKVGAVIPVDKSDPRYPLFAAQAAYLVGKEQTAWEGYLRNQDRLLQSFKDLDPQFMFWLIKKNTDDRRYESAERIAQAMLEWFESTSGSFEPEIRARLQNAYANIAFAKREYPKARASYNAVAVAREFEDTLAQQEALLRVAEVDRMTRQYDVALKLLEKLALRKDKNLRTEALYQTALVQFDQQEHSEAKETLEKVFALQPGHAEARILEGRINLKLNKLEDPTDLQIGTVTSQRYLVPGMPLKVTLEDRNLSVVGKSTNIEVRARTKSGDEEIFLLTPFGDSKTKFRGQLTTALAKVSKGNHVLEVLGDDVITYDYSEKFKQANNITDSVSHTLRVVTDAELYASSGRILTQEEREKRAMEEMIRKRIELRGETNKPQIALSTVRADNQVKPGNKINIRVLDPDRSTTAGKDTVKVRIAAASGDAVSAYTLEETDTHSGVFEGSVPTASGQPIAMATNTQEGKYPNFAISKKDYGPWVAQPDNVRPKTFSVDLNDNVKLAKMSMVAKVPARKIKKFLLQTSLNGKEFTTVGTWPNKMQQWDGSPKVMAAQFPSNRVPTRIEELDEYLEFGHIANGMKSAQKKISLPKIQWGWDIAGIGSDIGLNRDRRGKQYIARISAAFFQPRRQIRTFQIDPKGGTEGIRYMLAIDGKLAGNKRRRTEGENPQIQMKLSKGTHRLDIYIVADDSKSPVFELLCDKEEPPFIGPCPAEMFDPSKEPLLAQGVKVPAATIEADEAGENFSFLFAKPSIDRPQGTQARVVRLVLLDFETDAPAINKLTLTDAGGDVVLPTKEDFLELRKNDQLELVPGDRISVTYEDPMVISRGKELHETFLTATYSNAQISACFVEYEQTREGARPRYIPMYRFKPGDTVKVFVSDPDQDVSDKPDRVEFTARTSLGKPVKLEALETEAHSGVFLGTVFPLKADKKASRKSELVVEKGDDIILTYIDAENTDPGIPWPRTTSVEQTWFKTPELRVYDVVSRPLDEADSKASKGNAKEESHRFEERFPAERMLEATRPETVDYTTPTKAIIGGPLLVEVVFPSAAQSPASTVTIYAQTTSGRQAANVDANAPFDIRVPGTIKLSSTPGGIRAAEVGRGYAGVIIGQGPQLLTPLEEGRFAYNVPVELGALPEKSLAVSDGTEDPKGEKPSLMINGSDEIFLGLKYTDPKTKQTHWITKKIVLDADVFFDVMDRRYQEQMDGLYVGQNIYYRVIDPKKDLSDEKDSITLRIKTKSGRTDEVVLMETFSHSGIFKGLNKMVYAGAGKKEKEEESALSEDVLEVVYGDIVSASYRRSESMKPMERNVEIFKGSDGDVIPFTKRFRDSSIAVRTQFLVAEAYFELAKRHRQLGRPKLAQEEILHGKNTLRDAIRDYPDSSARAQADYLLANLALEMGNELTAAAKRATAAAQDAETDAESQRYLQQAEEATDAAKKHYAEAVTRFADIVSTFSESEYAPKAQFKKALTYERMGQIDEACEEYVKLSYRYPENELVAKTIARLGNYFLTKGKMMREEAKKQTDPIEIEKGLMQARKFFKTAGQVLGRLRGRFPTHELAGKTAVLSAQCYMHATEYELAVKTFQSVIEEKEYESDLIAEAMYWCGDCYMTTEDYVNSYRMFKRLTWDYPASMWAKYARGRLTDERLGKIAASEDG